MRNQVKRQNISLKTYKYLLFYGLKRNGDCKVKL